MNARDAALQLLGARRAGATICPSEVARALAGKDDWREAMPAVHAAVDALVSEGLVDLSWKGQGLARRSGPYRISRRSRSERH
ncbi:DUF3253 domain-containing protein [Novosphingobium lindaniclasticum]|uniref:DUF3253 domain-containing protein n=1 Tax=Novosphingobium lindaniclasticum TaxID=1329895 RepID=UPI00040A4079|nr:DUF3253 domain-containing protein [Novosphingobium lindaniclasticum]